MGYVHDTNMFEETPVNQITPTVGTWAMAVASNVWSYNHTAAADTSVLYIPLPLPANKIALKGCKLLSVEFTWNNGTAKNNGPLPEKKTSVPKSTEHPLPEGG